MPKTGLVSHKSVDVIQRQRHRFMALISRSGNAVKQQFWLYPKMIGAEIHKWYNGRATSQSGGHSFDCFLCSLTHTPSGSLNLRPFAASTDPLSRSLRALRGEWECPSGRLGSGHLAMGVFLMLTRRRNRRRGWGNLLGLKVC